MAASKVWFICWPLTNLYSGLGASEPYSTLHCCHRLVGQREKL